MDLYTTSFSLPHFRRSPHLRSSLSPLSTQLPLPNINTDPLPHNASSSSLKKAGSSASLLDSASGHNQVDKEWQAVQKIAEEITKRENCLVTVSREQFDPDLSNETRESRITVDIRTTTYNFHISGNYQNVLAARGAILRECPRNYKVILKIPRVDLLESPLSSSSTVKPDVHARLMGIAIETRAAISIVGLPVPGSPSGQAGRIIATYDGWSIQSDVEVSGPLSEPRGSGSGPSGEGSVNGQGGLTSEGSSQTLADEKNVNQQIGKETQGPVSYGLETERMCEVVVSGNVESVELAKVRILVLQDELSGLHAEICDIDYKLHNILASRRHQVIQSIQEETGTNIYFPTPLVGILNPPQPGSNQGLGYRSMGLSMQNTGISHIQTQLTGHSHTPTHYNMTPSNSHMSHNQPNWTMGPQMTGSTAPPHPHPTNNYLPHGRQHSGPIYNPHQHVQYPYQPQPMEFNPQTTRGSPYAGPAAQYGMNNMGSNVQMPHPGMNNMRGMNQHSPMPMNLNIPNHSIGQAHSPHLAPHMPPHHSHHSPVSQHQHNPYINHSPQSPMLPSSYHSNMQMPISPVGMNSNGSMNMGPMGMNHMSMGMNGMHGGYGQAPHPGLSIHGGEQGVLGKANQIWITGEFFGVQRARDMLLNVAMQKSKLVISRDTAILPRKLDWLLTERLEDVKNIMSDNGTYLQVPSVGTQASLITIFGDHRVNIERTIRSIMSLTCQFYVASFWLLPLAFDVLMPAASLNTSQLQPTLKRISHEAGAEIVFKSNCFEMHGLEAEVRAAVMVIMELELTHNFHHEIRFQIELANEHRDFISGKKNGKLNKIMKVAGVKVKFETFNDYNFLIDISGSDIGALQGLSLLQEELPAETSFHVPESYHKRIIGVGGKNIQRIMKLYGVYVKFSNSEEFSQIGGYSDNEDNVIARTPAKNGINLESLKQAVMEMVSPKDKEYITESVSIPRRYHRTLLGEKSIFIHDIESKTNSLVRFPYKESASDLVTIFGPESQVHLAAAMLLDHVPFEANLHVLPNPELTKLVSSPDFILFTERIKGDHQIAIAPSSKFGQGDEAIFKFRCQRSNVDFLSTARDALEEFLSQHKIQLYPAHAQNRVDTFADAFSHFNSKLLSTRVNGAGNVDGEPDSEAIVPPISRPRPQSAEVVKALFDDQPPTFRSSQDESAGYPGALSYHDPRRMSDLWQPPNQNQPEALSSKRDSDPIIHDKVRQATMGAPLLAHHHHPRISGARTQSLDISSLSYSRALMGGASAHSPNLGPLPASPVALSSSPGAVNAAVQPGAVGSNSYFRVNSSSNLAGHGKKGSGGSGKSVSLNDGLQEISEGVTHTQLSKP